MTCGGDRGQLDPGVLEHLLQPLDLGALLDLGLAIPGQVPQLTDLARRHEALAQQAVLKQLAQPRRVADIGLSPGDNQEHRLRELRPSLPEGVTVTAPAHPLFGEQLAVEGRRRVGGVPCLIVRLPDGTPGTIEVQATSAGSPRGERGGGDVAIG